MYGQTEATARMAYMPPDQLPGSPRRHRRSDPGRRLPSCGRGRAGDRGRRDLRRVGLFRPHRRCSATPWRRPTPRQVSRELELKTGDLEAVQRLEGPLPHRRPQRAGSPSCSACASAWTKVEDRPRARRGVRAVVAGDDSLLAVAVSTGDPGARSPKACPSSSTCRPRSSASSPSPVSRLLASGKFDYPDDLADRRGEQARTRRAGRRRDHPGERLPPRLPAGGPDRGRQLHQPGRRLLGYVRLSWRSRSARLPPRPWE